MKILVIFTGGTIGSCLKNGWISTDATTKYRLLDRYKGGKDVFDTVEPYSILSENLSASEINCLQKEIAKYLSSLGVDLIIGAHPHVIMPVDYIDDTLVIYSLGNFISNQLSIGLNQGIGLMVGMDIVVNENKVTFENLDYKLLYTYSTSYNTNYKVYPLREIAPYNMQA